MEKLRAASEYLGDEVVIAALPGPDGKLQAPVFLAENEARRLRGVPEAAGHCRWPVETRPGLVAVRSGRRTSVDGLAAALDAPPAASRARRSTRASRVAIARAPGFCSAPISPGDLEQQRPRRRRRATSSAEQKQIDRARWKRAPRWASTARARASPRGWPPRRPWARSTTFRPTPPWSTAFVVKNPAAIVDEVVGVQQRSAGGRRARPSRRRSSRSAIDVRDDLAASLGGEFSLSLDGPPFPVPSWKLVAEVYDPARLQATLAEVGRRLQRSRP